MLNATINRCSCGKRIARGATECRGCYRARAEKRYADASAIVATGRCPQCGAVLQRNLALTGWWQCGRYGVIGRAPGAAPGQCSFQTFTKY